MSGSPSVDASAKIKSLFSGYRLQNFEIRVGSDEHIGNNDICYNQLEAMESGVTKNFTCRTPIFGSWISVNKSADSRNLSPLHFREICVYSGKYQYSFSDN